jgi:asparagine synthase (glutamine-hydrolysing)
MCGINGFNFRDEKLIVAMNKEIDYRGLDSTGVFFDQNISFGHNRLSIIDLSPLGQQPMHNKAGDLSIIFNGEIYNFLEIRYELQKLGCSFQSHSDTEVLLQAYEKYGEECLQKINGIFAFAIWDKNKQELFIARDQLGVKPLFYYFNGNKFIFSSEIKPILIHSIQKIINKRALDLYFRFLYINGPETIWQNIFKLLPGHYLKLKGNNLEIIKYWQPRFNPEINDRNEARELLRKTFIQAVKRQMIADVRVGLFLSGGIDSTVILGLMSEFSPQVKTFSMGFDYHADNKFNEDFNLARKTAEFYNSDHEEFVLQAKDIKENIEKVVWHMDDLVSNPTQVAIYLLSKQAKKKVTVVLGGDGGDELFAGYDRYYLYNLISKLQKLPRILRQNELNKIIFSLANKKKIYDKVNLSLNQESFWEMMAQKENVVDQFLKPEFNFLLQSKDYILQNHFLEVFDTDFTKQMMWMDISTWLTDESLSMSDKLSMASGLEQRVPILDKEMIELAMLIPTKFKLEHHEQGKKIFREAFADYLPVYIYKKKKTGWFTPLAKWIRTDLRDFATEVLSEDYNRETGEILNFKNIQTILAKHLSGEQYAFNTIWSLINFQIWYRLNKK